MPWAVLGGATIALLAMFEPRLGGQGRIGADYTAFLPRLLADAYWFRLNGWWSVPWFSPAFCGGMPDWAGPQSMPYSFPQLITSYVDPVSAVRLTFAVFAALGAAGAWLLLRSTFGVSVPAALVGAVLFLFNGFYTREMLLGHLTYHPFMLTPWVAWLLLRENRSRWGWAIDGTFAGALVGAMIHAGMVALLVPIGLAWIALALIHGLRGGNLAAFWPRLMVAIGVGAALAASKLVAMGAFASQFPRDFYTLGGFPNPVNLVVGALRSVFYRVGNSFGSDMTNLSIALPANEWENGLTPIPLLILAAGLIRSGGRAPPLRVKGRLWMIVGLVSLCVVPLAVNFYTPGWNAVLKRLPIVKSSVTALRWFVFYVPPVVVLTALALDRLPRRAWLAATAIAGIVAFTFVFTVRTGKERGYDPKVIVKGWEALHSDNRVPDIEYMDVPLNADGSEPFAVFAGDDEVALGGNQVFCYDPIFGYAHEMNPWKGLRSGAPLDESEGVLNVKNPACDLYPVENHCRPGDQFSVAEKGRAAAFLSWGPLAFERPLKQRVADGLSLLAILGVVGLGIAVVLRAAHKPTA